MLFKECCTPEKFEIFAVEEPEWELYYLAEGEGGREGGIWVAEG